MLRRGAPVRLHATSGAWKASLAGLGIGASIGLPLAAFNAFANTLVQGRPVVWQSSGFPLPEALEPGLVEGIVYRFALLGIVWLLLRPFWSPPRSWRCTATWREPRAAGFHRVQDAVRFLGGL